MMILARRERVGTGSDGRMATVVGSRVGGRGTPEELTGGRRGSRCGWKLPAPAVAARAGRAACQDEARVRAAPGDPRRDRAARRRLGLGPAAAAVRARPDGGADGPGAGLRRTARTGPGPAAGGGADPGRAGPAAGRPAGRVAGPGRLAAGGRRLRAGPGGGDAAAGGRAGDAPA